MSRRISAESASRKDSRNTNTTKDVASLAGDATGLFETLQGHVDELRGIVQCNICIRPLYEPYTLACGHTFCYSCLTDWFSGGKSKKTCPDCRAPVKAQPAPAYMIRDVVQLFTSRAELLEKGETTAEHARIQRAEAERLDADKKNTNPRNGGLFKGIFNKLKFPTHQPIVDLEDNVVRCPVCSWELEEDSACEQCGYRPSNDSMTEDDDDLSQDDVDLDSDEMSDYNDDDIEDAFGEIDDFWNNHHDNFPGGNYAHDMDLQAMHGLHRSLPLHRHSPFIRPPVVLPHQHLHNRRWAYDSEASDTHGSGDEEEEDDDEIDTDMDSFIDDGDDLPDYESESDRSTVVGGPDPYSYDDSHLNTDASVTHDEGTVDDLEIRDTEDEEDDLDDYEDDEEEEPVRPAVTGNRRRPAPVFQELSSSPVVTGLAASIHSPVSRGFSRQRPQHSRPAGGSATNAINVDDDSDEGPVGPGRRTQRGNCR